MNARMTSAKQITLPDDVVEALKLEPGSEVAFARGPGTDLQSVETLLAGLGVTWMANVAPCPVSGR